MRIFERCWREDSCLDLRLREDVLEMVGYEGVS